MVSFKKGEIMKGFNEWMQERTPEEQSARNARARKLWTQIRPRAHARRIEDASRYTASDWAKFDNLDWNIPSENWTPAHYFAAMRGDKNMTRQEVYKALQNMFPGSKEAVEAEYEADAGDEAGYDHGRDYDAHGDYD